MSDIDQPPVSTPPPAPGRYPRNVYVTAGASLLTDISSEMVVHLVPLFLAGVLKTSTPLIGLIDDGQPDEVGLRLSFRPHRQP